MTGIQTGALVVALVAPVLIMMAVLGTRARPKSAVPPFRWAQAVVVVSAGAWLTLVASGARVHAGGFYVSPLVAAAGCGTALITVAVIEGTSRRRLSAACGALAAVSLGLTAGGDGALALAVVGGLAVAAALTVAASDPTAPRPGRMLGALLAASGVVACAIGFATTHARSGRW
ncbi:MAG: hypothetical protein M3011_07935, partial [Actinomycetota bacterium]|nr:hypothetical protein [Actinomycetota bacterium]